MFHVAGDTIVFSVKLTCAPRSRRRKALMVSLLSRGDNRIGETEIYCNCCHGKCFRHGAASCDRSISGHRARVLNTLNWFRLSIMWIKLTVNTLTPAPTNFMPVYHFSWGERGARSCKRLLPAYINPGFQSEEGGQPTKCNGHQLVTLK